MEYRLTSEAHANIAAIAQYIAQDSPDAAVGVLARIERTLQIITLMPRLGRMTGHRDTRSTVVRRMPYVIVYRQVGDTLEILSVFHTAQDPKKRAEW